MTDRSFVIDSRALETVGSALYGYLFTQDDKIWIDMLPEDLSEACLDTGVYCMIIRDGDKITIRQNYFGAFGLFIYQAEDWFCISNSFFRLCEYLNTRLSPDMRFVEEALYASETIMTAGRTFAREIKKTDSKEIVVIDIPTRSFSIEKQPVRPFLAIHPDSAEAMQTLDDWYWKWVRRLRGLAALPAPMITDLSGGLDTRIILSMLWNGNVDINRCLKVKTNEFDTRKDSEDFRIAARIAEDWNIDLNSDAVFEVEPDGALDLEEVYDACKRISFGRSAMSKYTSIDYSSPVFALKGLGSIIKGGPNGDREPDLGKTFKNYTGLHFTKEDLFSDRNGEKKLRLQRYMHVREVFDVFLAGYPGKDTKKQASYLYARIEGEGRDVGKALDWMSGNLICVSPFMDPDVVQFDNDPYREDPLFLCTLILQRYRPELLAYPIEGFRAFKKASFEKAEELNRKYPLQRPVFESVQKPYAKVKAKIVSKSEIEDYLKTRIDEETLEKVADLVGQEKAEDLRRELETLHDVNNTKQAANILLAIGEFTKYL